MLQAKTEEQENFVLDKICGFYTKIINDGKTLYVEMDDDCYYFEIDFDTMAEIVDYLREQNNKQQGYGKVR